MTLKKKEEQKINFATLGTVQTVSSVASLGRETAPLAKVLGAAQTLSNV